MGSNRIARRVEELLSTGITAGKAIALAVSEKPAPELQWYTATDGRVMQRIAR